MGDLANIEPEEKRRHDTEGPRVSVFHFDQANVNTIGLQGAPNKERIYCLNFDGNAGVAQRITQLGIPASNIWSDDINQFAHIDEAIGNGFLEQ